MGIAILGYHAGVSNSPKYGGIASANTLIKDLLLRGSVLMWWARGDLNPRPPGYQPGAPPG